MKQITGIVAALFITTTVTMGTTYTMITDIGTSAKMISIGNVQGFSQDADGVFENPASGAYVKGNSVTMFTTTFMNEVTYQKIAVAKNFSFGTLSLGYMSQGVTDIPETYESDETGKFNVLDTIGFKRSVYKLGFSRQVTEKLSIGMSVNAFTDSVGSYSSFGQNMDLGGLYKNEDLEVSLQIKNAIPGRFVEFSNDQSEELQVQPIFGVKKGFYDIDLYGQYMMTEGLGLASAGLSYRPKLVKEISLNVGYKNYLVEQNVRSGATMGIGLTLGGMQIHYAYEHSDHVIFNGKHYISAGYNF